MVASANFYSNAFAQAFSNNVKWTTGTIKMALVGSGYTPNLATNVHWSDVSANEVTGTGYTAGGATLSSCTATTTAANSWGVTAAVSTAYTVGQVVKPVSANGLLYRCVVAGTSGSSAPAWPTVNGQTVADGTVTWVCAGSSITVLTSAAASWGSSTITASYAVIYDADSGVTSTEPLIDLQTFASAQSDSGGTFQVSPDATYGWGYLTPA